MKLDFTDKPTYLAWRTEWRRLISEKNAQIRELRKNLVLADQALAKLASSYGGHIPYYGYANGGHSKADHDIYHKQLYQVAGLASKLHYARTQARDLFELREEAKERCDQQWKAARIAEPA